MKSIGSTGFPACADKTFHNRGLNLTANRYRPNKMTEDKALSFLSLIRRAHRGRLKVYLGYGAGVGKTWQMLKEGHRLLKEGVDVGAGLGETHGREETAQLVEGLEVVPRRQVHYRGIVLEEMGLEAGLDPRPE